MIESWFVRTGCLGRPNTIGWPNGTGEVKAAGSAARSRTVLLVRAAKRVVGCIVMAVICVRREVELMSKETMKILLCFGLRIEEGELEVWSM